MNAIKAALAVSAGALVIVCAAPGAWAVDAPDPRTEINANTSHHGTRNHTMSFGAHTNVHGNVRGPVYNHQVSEAEVRLQPGQGYIGWGTGFIVTNPRPARPRNVWVPGHYEWVTRRVWVPGFWDEQYIPPVYQRRLVNGREVLVVVQEERIERVWVPDHYEVVSEQVWVPGRWERVW